MFQDAYSRRAAAGSHYLLLLGLVLVFTGCSRSQFALDSPATGALSGRSYSISALATDGSDLDSPLYSIHVTDQAERTLVTVTAAGAVEQGCFFGLRYDPQQHTPLDCTAIGAGSDQVLQLAHVGEPGCIEFGAVALPGSGYAAGGGTRPIARASFVSSAAIPQALELRVAGSTSLPEVDLQHHFGAALDSQAGILYVQHYSKAGDYNLDGIVSVHDLIPLALHWGQKVPQNDHSLLSLLDTNGDRRVNNGDIVAIGANFGSKLQGYRIYHSADLDKDYGLGISPAPLIEAAFQLALPKASDEYNFGDWPAYVLDLPDLNLDHYYWATAIVDGEEARTSVPASAPLHQYHPAYELSFDSGRQRLGFLYTFTGDCGQDGMITLLDIGGIGLRLDDIVDGPESTAWMADPTGNGIVQPADVFAVYAGIGTNLRGFNVYSTSNTGELPADPIAASGITPLAFFDRETGFIPGNPGARNIANVDISIPSGAYIWIRPVGTYQFSNHEVEGACSEVIQVP